MSDRDEREERAYADGYRIGRMHGTAVDPTVALEAQERLIAADVEIARLRGSADKALAAVQTEAKRLRAENELLTGWLRENKAEAEKAWTEVHRLRDEVQDPSVDVANVNAAYVIERDDNARLRAALERVAVLAEWTQRDRHEPDKVLAYALELHRLAAGGQSEPSAPWPAWADHMRPGGQS